MSEIVDKWRSLQKGPRVPRPSTPPKTPRYDVRGIQSLAPINERRRLTTQDVAGTYPSLVAKRPELLARLAKRGYNVQEIQSLRNVDIPQRTPRQARAIKNRAVMATWRAENDERMLQFGGRYAGGLTVFNALPQAITSLANRPLQAAITHGPPALQRTILRAVGPWPGAGLARLVDTAIRGGTAGGIPGLNFGSGYLFADAPRGAANIPETRPSMFGGGPPAQTAQRQQFGFSPPRWGIGR